MKNKILIAISGASGAIYPKLLINKLFAIKDQWEELSVVMSTNAKQIWSSELGNEDFKNLPVKFYEKNNFNAPFASGSARLKERRKLVLMLRETPYSLIHIKNMEAVTLAGGIICPATPSFYSKPKTIEEAATTVVDRLLDLSGLDVSSYRWGT